MQDLQLLKPDAETFARVWKRVMPDESLSQIVVHAPAGEGGVPQQTAHRDGWGDTALLARLLELLEEGERWVNAVVRRQPGVRPLGESLHRSTAQLRPMWYLLTGERWQSRQGKILGDPFVSTLREQYLREIHFSQLCRRGMEGGDGALEELLPGLEEDSRRRRRMIRQLLGGMGPGRT